MANVSLSVPPGYYLEAQNASWQLSAAVDYISFTKDGPSPAISKYIAYDTLTPPNPFIAVTQDGNGNVVYDGGFPKFYNSLAPEAGIDSLFSMEYKGTRVSGATGNTYYYDAFTDQNVTIAAGDKLVYDILMDSANARVGIDAITNADPGNLDGWNYSLRDWGQQISVIKDQNGISIHPSSDLGGRGVGAWYHREFDLTAAAGATFIKWSLAYEGEIPGTFYTRFKEVYVLDKNGKVKATLFKDSIKLPNSTSVEGGASGYTDTAKYIYDPRSRLSPSFKYLFNAIRWVANPEKAKKILVLGDTISTAAYPVKGNSVSGFSTSMQRIASACGFTCDIKDLSDYTGGKLNCTLAELNAYALVIVISTAYDVNNAELITPAAVTDLVTFRQQGGGLIFITDHGTNVLTNVNQVATAEGAGFYGTANRVIANFGAFFSGNYDRVPVNVGFLRTNYGDHPLYSGMTNAEDISAGGSESKIVLADFVKYTAANAPSISASNNGVNSIKAIAVLKDGTVETYNFIYVIATGEIIQFRNGQGTLFTQFPESLESTRDFTVEVLGSGLGTLVGDILLNQTKVGEIGYTAAGGSTCVFYIGSSALIRVVKGDVFTAKVTSPFQYSRSLNVNRIQPVIKGASLAQIIQGLRTGVANAPLPGATIRKTMADLTALNPGSPLVYQPDSSRNVKSLRLNVGKDPALPETTGFIFGTSADAAAAMTTLVPPSNATIFNTWDRFGGNQFFKGGVGVTGEAAQWVWDETKQAAVMSVNSGGWTGFLSLDLVENYELDVVVQSDDADDDMNGIVLAFDRADGNNNRLVLCLCQAGLTPTASHSLNIYSGPSATLKNLVNNNFAGTTHAWSGKFTRVKVSRQGDYFKILASKWGSMDLDPASLIEYTLTSDALAQKFKGPKAWGFCNISQAKSFFKLNDFSGGQLYDIVVDVQTNKVYRFNNGVWSVLPGVKAQDIYGTPRTLVNSQTGKSFRLNTDGTITAL